MWERCLREIAPLEAAESMRLAHVVSLPHLKVGDQRALWSGWSKAVGQATQRAAGNLGNQISRVRSMLAGVGIQT